MGTRRALLSAFLFTRSPPPARVLPPLLTHSHLLVQPSPSMPLTLTLDAARKCAQKAFVSCDSGATGEHGSPAAHAFPSSSARSVVACSKVPNIDTYNMPACHLLPRRTSPTDAWLMLVHAAVTPVHAAVTPVRILCRLSGKGMIRSDSFSPLSIVNGESHNHLCFLVETIEHGCALPSPPL